jgi:hypothetical protein
MRPSLNIFTTGVLAARQAVDLRSAWLNAAHNVHDAYLAWRDAERSDRTPAFLAYQAALDREEAAARALQLGVSRGPVFR